MPTVRPGIKPLAVFPAPSGKAEGKPLRVYPAEAWEKWGGEPGLFRVMVGDAWVSRNGERASFYDQEGMGEVLRRWGLGALGLSLTPQPGCVLPDVPPYSYVWAPGPNGENVATRTKEYPFRDSAGDWRVRVYLFDAALPLDVLSLRQRGEGVDA